MNHLNRTALRLSAAAHLRLDAATSQLRARAEQLRAAPDRGDVNIPTILWIVGGVLFAVTAVAAFKTLGDKHLADMTSL
ncbi:hypothetical protein P3T36_007260 [Kitasatospora sp. MAP12-15]|uniref:hypothetical protein n=1 Tax=unclassified Kitasatospora TaxID=2633591 RepID=UPI002474E0DA|nr:hypothetical protein [Kitasatospora sp. MAP12-44]MDH6115644.1 hypothetical protein [Kitasatospora sp. MAP12-44]